MKMLSTACFKIENQSSIKQIKNGVTIATQGSQESSTEKPPLKATQTPKGFTLPQSSV